MRPSVTMRVRMLSPLSCRSHSSPRRRYGRAAFTKSDLRKSIAAPVRTHDDLIAIFKEGARFA